MNEADWLGLAQPDPMLDYLGADEGLPWPEEVRDRKLTLAACAGSRRLWGWLGDERSWRAVQTSERFADGEAGWAELDHAKRIAAAAQGEARSSSVAEARRAAWAAVWTASHPVLWGPQSRRAVRSARRLRALEGGGDLAEEERREAEAQAALLRDVFGNPFRPAFVDAAALWRGSVVEMMARTIYAEGRFGDLPVLADALEEAGCADRALLDHCRSGASHVRGCWAVDALLGKG
jgi:hypothetical protein